MNGKTVELQRARRRYKALLRERQSLASSGSIDPVVEDEIRKLEDTHAELRPPLPPPRPDHAVAASPPLVSSTTGEEGAKQSSSGARTVSPSRELQPKSSTQQPFAPIEKWCVTDLDTGPKPHTPHARGGVQPPARRDGHLVLFLLRLFNETHQRSLLGCRNCVAIASLSIAVAVLHCTVLDPSSRMGSLVTPSLLCCLVHANNLAALFMKHPQRLSVPALVVYVCFDVVPSIALDVVAYHLSLTLMGFCGARPVSFAC
ncbi:hypothetical protein GH5_08499 [Leishmania sp. Ghana 2012 LV757]|uniref:hypothetical protein n=1 Tax=Leishmania sp. Ghana 2012 LV757 TaxID=2803181 RepID=UPI001B54ADC2|nr:hypothetical protein GH5_08499 [Leishmania sp. Ghana 2012 LV757]